MPKTKIPWATRTWNPIEGCLSCSLGCDNCYARRLVQRFAANPAFENADGINPYEAAAKWNGTLAEFPARWQEPMAWRKPQRVFVGSRSDIALWLPGYIAAVGDMANSRMPYNAARHAYLLLTKRPEMLAAKCGEVLRHCWLGVTACNQDEADAKIPALLQIPAAGYWLSVEPMLGPITIDCVHLCQDELCRHARLSWVVCGGESGKGARPMQPEWARSLRDQCRDAGVPWWIKQWGDAGVESDGCWTDGENNAVIDELIHHALPAALRLPGEVAA